MKHLFIILTFFAGIQSLSSQAWTKDKGQGFYKADFSTIRSTQLFDSKGEVVSAPEQANNVFSLYAEHGLGKRFEIMAYAPFVHNTLTSQSESGIGDIDIAIKYAIKKTGVAVSTSLLLGIPSGKSDVTSKLNTGDGEFNQMLKINAGSGGDKWWAQTGLAFNNRSKDFSDEIRFNLEFGYKFLNNKLLTILKIGSVQSTKNGKVAPNPYGLYSNDVEYFSPAIELMYYIKPKYGVSLRGAGAGAGAQNIQAAPQLSFSFFADIK